MRHLARQTPSYRDYVSDKKRKGEKPLAKEQWESKILGKPAKEEKKLDPKKEKAKKKLVSKGVLKFKPTPDNLSLAGKDVLKTLKGQPIDLARDYSPKQLQKLEKKLKKMDEVARKSKIPLGTTSYIRNVVEAQRVGKRAKKLAQKVATAWLVAEEYVGE